MRDHELEQQTGYNPNKDYKAVLDEYNSLVGLHDKAGVERILSENGGLINLLLMYNYQVHNHKK